MSKLNLSVLVGNSLVALCLAASGRADTIAVTLTGGSPDGQGNSLGFEFTPNARIAVTQLGFLNGVVLNGDGVAGDAHNVGIFAIGNSTPLATAVVDNGAAGSTEQFEYTALGTPLTLTAGTSYLIGGTTNGDTWLFNATGFATASQVTFDTNAYNEQSDNVLRYPGGALGSFYDPGFIGPNFQFNVVPEPGSLSLLVAGCATLILFTFKRRKSFVPMFAALPIRRSLLAAGILTGFLAAGSPANANLLTNGSFEQSDFNGGAGLSSGQFVPVNSGDVTGWTTNSPGTAPGYWYFGPSTGYGVAQDGQDFMSPAFGLTISQSFAVTGGQPNLVSFYEGERADAGGNGDTITATITLAAGTATGTGNGALGLTENASNQAAITTQSAWEQFSFSFIPSTNTIATITFASPGYAGHGQGEGVIDNVSVTVPEPSSLALLLGFACACVVNWLRKRRPAGRLTSGRAAPVLAT